MIIQRIIKRIFDIVLSLLSVIVFSPVLLIAAIGVVVSNGFPIIYKAKRMGKNMKEITVFKFRTMRVNSDKAGAITGKNDSRVFWWGKILRKAKIDELPQLFNILIGNMSIVGPRPEDINVVNNYYTNEEKNTLNILPGLASPGSLFNYTHGDLFLNDENTDETYINKFLHIKLSLDLYYMSHWSLLYDAKIIFRTMYTILMISVFKKQLNYPTEYLILYKDK